MITIFCNYEIVFSTSDSFVEGETIDLKVYECENAHEIGKHIKRTVRFDKDAGDLYIVYKHKKYFYNEFK